MVVFLCAGDNNRMETVLQAFVSATTIYGLPSRIRTDMGGENTEICEFMELIRGENRGSSIKGPSTHNVRIERAWVDVWAAVSNVYYKLFHYLEYKGHLDVDDMADLWCLHYLFLPRLNHDLKMFQQAWNNHHLSTERNQTPLQLFVLRSLSLYHSDSTAVNDIFKLDETIAESSGSEEESDEEANEEPATVPMPINAQDFETLQTEYPPLQNVNTQLGIESYLHVRRFVKEHALNVN